MQAKTAPNVPGGPGGLGGRFVAVALAAALAVLSFPVTALAAGSGAPDGRETVTMAAAVTPEEAYQAMTVLRGTYPEGMRWTNDNSYYCAALRTTGYGCAAFAFILSDAAFGDNPGTYYYDLSQVRVGDILRLNGDSHSVIVLSVGSGGVTVAEGNFNDSVHWGRYISFSEMAPGFSYGITRYLDDQPAQPQAHKVTLVQPEHATLTILSDGTAPGDTVSVSAQAEDGYKIDRFVVDGVSAFVSGGSGARKSLRFVMPDNDVTVTASVSPIERHEVRFSITGSGSASASPSSAAAGAQVTLSLSPAADYQVAQDGVTAVGADGSRLAVGGTGNVRTLVMPDADVTVSVAFVPADQPVSGFPDVPADAWFLGHVEWAVDNGVMSGYADGMFGPEDNLERQDMAVILYRYLDGGAAGPCGLPDVLPGEYYVDEVNWCVERGIFGGYDNGLFGVGDPLTREQLALILYRIEGSPATRGDLSRFPDGDLVSPVARDAMAWAVGEGLISGYENGSLGPTTSVNRAIAVTIIHRWAESR